MRLSDIWYLSPEDMNYSEYYEVEKCVWVDSRYDKCVFSLESLFYYSNSLQLLRMIYTTLTGRCWEPFDGLKCFKSGWRDHHPTHLTLKGSYPCNRERNRQTRQPQRRINLSKTYSRSSFSIYYNTITLHCCGVIFYKCSIQLVMQLSESRIWTARKAFALHERRNVGVPDFMFF